MGADTNPSNGLFHTCPCTCPAGWLPTTQPVQSPRTGETEWYRTRAFVGDVGQRVDARAVGRDVFDVLITVFIRVFIRLCSPHLLAGPSLLAGGGGGARAHPGLTEGVKKQGAVGWWVGELWFGLYLRARCTLKLKNNRKSQQRAYFKNYFRRHVYVRYVDRFDACMVHTRREGV